MQQSAVLRFGAQITVDLVAYRSNIRKLRQLLRPGTQMMAVVKANAYGHGAEEMALAAEQAGVDWLGTADFAEALALRQAGVTVPLLCWIHPPFEDFSAFVDQGITPALSTLAQFEAALSAGVPEVQLVLDTGLGRNGLHFTEWEEGFPRLAELLAGGSTQLSGVMSHLSNTSEQDDFAQAALFDQALEALAKLGLRPKLRHLAASAAALKYPELHYDLVRIGIASYGLAPSDEQTLDEFGLHPVLSLSAELVASATGSFEIALGAVHGLPQQLEGFSVILERTGTTVTLGRVGLHSTAVLAGLQARPGDTVLIVGASTVSDQTADALARHAETINYEIVTRLHSGIERRFLS